MKKPTRGLNDILREENRRMALIEAQALGESLGRLARQLGCEIANFPKAVRITANGIIIPVSAKGAAV